MKGEFSDSLNYYVRAKENKFNLEKINGLNFNNFSESDCSFYNNGIHDDIDKQQDKIDTVQNFMSYLVNTLETHIDDKIYFKNIDD